MSIIAKKDEEVNKVLKRSQKKKLNNQQKTVTDNANKEEQYPIQQQPIQACQKLQLVCEQLNLTKLAESTDF